MEKGGWGRGGGMADREGGGGAGKAFKQLQLPDMWPHLCSVFWKKKIPPPNHTTPLSLFDTKFQDPEKTQSASSSFWGRGLAIGSLFLQKLG